MLFTRRLTLAALLVLLCAAGAGSLAAQTEPTTFTYQGYLEQDGAPVDGTCDLLYSLWDAPQGGTQVGQEQTATGIAVREGRFTAPLRFGSEVWSGAPRYLELAVRCPAQSGNLTPLDGRVELTAAPYALYSQSASWSGLREVPAGFADDTDDDSLGALTCANGEIAEWNGVQWVCSIDDVGEGGGGGDITTVNAGEGLIGGGVSGTVTISASLTVLQRRVSDECPAGSSIRAINEDGTVVCEPDDGGTGGGTSGWALTGNAGTDPAQNFLGTTDNQALELRANNERVARFEPANDDTIGSRPNVILGHADNTVDAGAIGATIGGGGYFRAQPNVTIPNRVTDDFGTVGGGQGNEAGRWGTVGGGQLNTAANLFATVGGGVDNEASADHATVGGGENNDANAVYATIGGGDSNQASTDHATIGGGVDNAASGDVSTIGGGEFNQASAEYATVSGGGANQASGEVGSVVGGGTSNAATANFATVSGGQRNDATASYVTVGGGFNNEVSADFATVGGGDSNQASADFATISGGGRSDIGNFDTSNRATDDYGTVGGGGNNQAGNADAITGNAIYATVGGGEDNQATASYATVGGGDSNEASGFAATTSGGSANEASANFATVGGGDSNAATGIHTTIGGGENNAASGTAATVPGGADNQASGAFSFAAGRGAQAANRGAFVWADAPVGAANPLASSADNQFLARATGGFGFYTDNAATVGCTLTAGTWNCTSDRSAKENITPVEGREVLEQLATIPIATWNYETQDASVRHIGPMAQDFAAAFAVGNDNRMISTVDADGVALAAIQGLHEIVQEQEAQLAAQQQQLDALETRLATLESQQAPRTASGALPWVWLLVLPGALLALGWLRRGRGGQQ